MFHCQDCWDNPCTCGSDFKHFTNEKLAEQIQMLQKMLDKRQGKIPGKLPQEPLVFENGITVAELKAMLKDWPEKDQVGDPTQVWMSVGPDQSSPVKQIRVIFPNTLPNGDDTGSIVFDVMYIT